MYYCKHWPVISNKTKRDFWKLDVVIKQNCMNCLEFLIFNVNFCQLRGGGGMVPDFSGRLILCNELGVIGRASTDNLGVLLGPRAQCGSCGHRWQKVAQKTKI